MSKLRMQRMIISTGKYPRIQNMLIKAYVDKFIAKDK